ncbi:MAG: GNAT family N-acetyltransferase [Gemmataceae bacterium]|nr:GNAT family N-acetyltransferase [Gemmataceae bacterium]
MWFPTNHSARSKLTLRWAQRADFGTLAAVEGAASGPGALDPEQLEERLTAKSHAALLAETDRVVGYLLYHLDVTRQTVHIVRLAVLPEQQRRGIGSQLLQRLVQLLHSLPGIQIFLLLHERNLAGQLFAKARGFRARHIHRKFFEDADAYLFEWQPPRPASPPSPLPKGARGEGLLS